MSRIFSDKTTAGAACQKKPGDFLLLPGRWHAITKAQEAALRKAVASSNAERRLVFVMTASDKGGSKRHPLYASERRRLLRHFAESLRREFEIYEIRDVSDKENWTDYVAAELSRLSKGCTIPSPETTTVVTGNPDVIARYKKRSYLSIQELESTGELPAEFLAVVANNGDWRKLASESTRLVYEQEAVRNRIARIFRDILLNEEGELSTGRDFATYAAGMDASTQIKLRDICPWVKGGKVVDKGCGTGSLLVHLSELFPESEIVGMDLSKELLAMSESKHYPNHNVAVVKGNIIKQRFRAETLSTVIYSSVMHEVYSYNGYDRAQVRLALANSRAELIAGGRLIIRDGIMPDEPNKLVWMRLDKETADRFRRFAREFKGKSAKPGVEFEEKVIDGKTCFRMSLHSAGEFLSKKDYLANWAIEVNEEFGVFTLSQWRQELESAGYRVLECSSYLNDWIEKNRYLEHAWLFEDENGKPGKALPYPDTTAVIVAEKIA